MKIKNLIILPAIALAVLFTSCEKEPKASFSASKTEVDIDEVVTFTNTTVDGETYSWNFGDGNTSTLLSPTHKYTTAGTYTVTLTAENGKKTDVATATIKVKEAAATNGLTYNNTNYPLTKAYFLYYGAIGNNPNSFNFDIVLTDNGINFVDETGQGNMVYFEAWSNSATDLTAGNYTFDITGDPNTYTIGMFGFNFSFDNGTGDIFEVTGGNFVISKTGNEHVINASLTLDNSKTLAVSFKGVFNFVDYSQKKSATKKFRK